MFSLSIVLPVYNEAESLPSMWELLSAVRPQLPSDHEIIFVDDGSFDASFSILKDFALQDSAVTVVRLRTNSGQTAALLAGFAHARKDVVVTLDADGQNDPADIRLLLLEMAKGYDVVSGWRVNRQDPFWNRRLPSRTANSIISWITGVALHDYGCTLKAYRREILDGVRLYGEMHRFLPAYMAWHGARVTEIPVRHHPRKFGISKYGLSRTLKVVLDLIVVKFLTKYFTKPIHFFGAIGVLLFFLGMMSGSAAIILKFMDIRNFVETPLPLVTVFFALMGIQFLLLGILAEVQTRIYFESQQKAVYSIREVVKQ